MVVALPTFRVGKPLRHDCLSVFPLFSQPANPVEYLVAEEALAGGSATVEEVSEAGSVPDLLVENKGDLRVLFLEGQELIGAKQNRILNTSVLVAAHAKLKVPVSCVEQRRWRYSERNFKASGSYAPAKLRRALKASVGESFRPNADTAPTREKSGRRLTRCTVRWEWSLRRPPCRTRLKRTRIALPSFVIS